LTFVADPQLIDPHSYPGRPWPLSSLTVLITDNYLRRGYNQLQSQLHPDSVFFLGDLFDGGREWKTSHGDFSDPEWAKGHRPSNEQKYVKKWNRKYGEDFWLREYARFGRIFVGPWNSAGAQAGSGQRGRKLVASLPGNHDLGFGSEIKVPVRDRFSAFFGEGNRVDVVGNHTIVSVDTVSLSAGTSDQMGQIDLKPIYYPTELFLKDVQLAKRRAVEKELRFWRGEVEEVKFDHRVEDLNTAKVDDLPSIDPGEGAADFPTILLTHVPLYRDPGTPCGPMREHWPPTKPPKGQTDPVRPDNRNAISVSGGYQYQNVLSEEDSIKLVKEVGNVVHVFSGDDHDYCEVVHSARKDNVREITVKSMSMAMGVPTPGFLMVSLYNPIGTDGTRLPGSPKATLQTHLCLLPNQISTYMKYASFIFISLVILIIRAFLVPILKLTPFALEPEPHSPSSSYSLLPTFKDKVEEDPHDGPRRTHHSSSTSGSASAGRYLSSRFNNPSSRGRSPSINTDEGRNSSPKTLTGKHKKASGSGPRKWGWGGGMRGSPRIEISGDDFYDGGKSRSTWRAATARSGSTLGVVGREIWTTVWRVAWLVVLFWCYLAWKG
jgi:ethanolamine phosphate phosphodiesterase